MYCNYCGQPVNENASVCLSCGHEIAKETKNKTDKSSMLIAVLSFFIPIIGLILFLVYHDDKPKMAKSAGKGALIGFITGIILSIIFTILFFLMGIGIFEQSVSLVKDGFESFENSPSIIDDFNQYDWQDNVDVTFGEWEIEQDDYFVESSLEVIITNKHPERCSYFITIEAVDENGYRLSTDLVYVDSLNSGQSTIVEAFEYINSEKLNEYRTASFNVIEVSQTIK